MSTHTDKLPVSAAQWVLLIGLCSTAAGVLSYFQLERHSFVSTSDFEFLFLERTFLPALLLGLLTTILGAGFWAWRAPTRDVAFYGFGIMVLVPVILHFIPVNVHGWTESFGLVGAAGMLIGALFLVFATVRFFKRPRTKSLLQTKLERLQTIAAVLLLAVPLYLLVPPDSTLVQMFPGLAITAVLAGIAIGVFILALSMRSRILNPARAALVVLPNDALTLKNWRAGNYVSLTLSHSIAVYGLVIQMAGHPRYESLPFYIAACLLLILWTPRIQRTEPFSHSPRP
jgi:hypothetical protein